MIDAFFFLAGAGETVTFTSRNMIINFFELTVQVRTSMNRSPVYVSDCTWLQDCYDWEFVFIVIIQINLTPQENNILDF